MDKKFYSANFLLLHDPSFVLKILVDSLLLHRYPFLRNGIWAVSESHGTTYSLTTWKGGIISMEKLRERFWRKWQTQKTTATTLLYSPRPNQLIGRHGMMRAGAQISGSEYFDKIIRAASECAGENPRCRPVHICVRRRTMVWGNVPVPREGIFLHETDKVTKQTRHRERESRANS